MEPCTQTLMQDKGLLLFQCYTCFVGGNNTQIPISASSIEMLLWSCGKKIPGFCKTMALIFSWSVVISETMPIAASGVSQPEQGVTFLPRCSSGGGGQLQRVTLTRSSIMGTRTIGFRHRSIFVHPHTRGDAVGSMGNCETGAPASSGGPCRRPAPALTKRSSETCFGCQTNHIPMQYFQKRKACRFTKQSYDASIHFGSVWARLWVWKCLNRKGTCFSGSPRHV